MLLAACFFDSVIAPHSITIQLTPPNASMPHIYTYYYLFPFATDNKNKLLNLVYWPEVVAQCPKTLNLFVRSGWPQPTRQYRRYARLRGEQGVCVWCVCGEEQKKRRRPEESVSAKTQLNLTYKGSGTKINSYHVITNVVCLLYGYFGDDESNPRELHQNFGYFMRPFSDFRA